MGPPKRLKDWVRSRMVTLMAGFLDKTLAKARPPTPPPAIKTLRGLASEIASGVSVVVGASVATKRAVEDKL